MKILVDLEEVKLNRLSSSIPVWIFRFLSSIPEDCEHEFTLLLDKSIKDFIQKKYPRFNVLEFDKAGITFKGYRLPKYHLRQYELNQYIVRNGIDIYFVPSDFQYRTIDRVPCQKVIVIHDLKALKEAASTLKTARRTNRLYNMYKRAIESADKVITISKYTKQDILYYYPETPDSKIHVVYNSVQLCNESVKPLGLDCNNYILYVNTLQRYKNSITLLKAFNAIKYQIDCNLVLVGRETDYWSDVLSPYISQNMPGRVVHLQNMSDAELRYLYDHAALFVTPSLHEGFGYTPIEAAMCNVPVVSSIQESLPDATRGLLNYYFPAMDADALALKIRDCIQNPPSSDKLSEIAETYMDLYSLKNYYKNIVKVFEL